MHRKQFRSTPLDSQKEELAKQEEVLRKQMAELQKVIADAPKLAEEWWRQVQALRGWPSFRLADFRRLRRDFGVSWVVVGTPQRDGLTCPYQNSELAVCRLE